MNIGRKNGWDREVFESHMLAHTYVGLASNPDVVEPENWERVVIGLSFADAVAKLDEIADASIITDDNATTI